MSTIGILTDFGLSDPYVGIMKGVILSINPSANIVDICHLIKPQDIIGGAFTLRTSFAYFPQGTIFIAVVDPGVGTERAALLVETDRGTFIGPDNGLLSWSLSDSDADDAGIPLAKVKRIIKLTNSRFWLPVVSHTFHGRDVFAPVAAHYSLGIPASEFGEETDHLKTIPWPKPVQDKDGRLIGEVVHIDHFGNVITNIPAASLGKSTSQLQIEIAGHLINGISTSYSGTELLAIAGSAGYIEISLPNGNAAAELDIIRGTAVRVSFSTDKRA